MVNSSRKLGAKSHEIAHVHGVGAQNVIYLLFCQNEKVFGIHGACGAVEMEVGTAEVVGVDSEKKRSCRDVLHVVPLADE